MAMVSADGSSQSFGGLTAQIGWFGLRVGGHPALSLHSSNEPRELSQWLCQDDSTINIVVVIIIIIIIIIIMQYTAYVCSCSCCTMLFHPCDFVRHFPVLQIQLSQSFLCLHWTMCFGWRCEVSGTGGLLQCSHVDPADTPTIIIIISSSWGLQCAYYNKVEYRFINTKVNKNKH